MPDLKKPAASPARLTEAIKLLNDWNKWLVTVQTASIASLGFLLKIADLKEIDTSLGKLALLSGAIAVALFVISIALSSYLLLFLPAIAEEVPESFSTEQPAKSLFRTNVPFSPGWEVGTYTTWQSRTFVFGIAFFALTFALMVSTAFLNS